MSSIAKNFSLSSISKRLSFGGSVIAQEPSDAEKRQAFISMQVVCLIAVGIMAAFWWCIVERFWPDFFSPSKVSHTSTDILGSIAAFWPLFVYCAAMSVFALMAIKPRYLRTNSAEEMLFLDTVVSIFAGIWEELGYRCVFIMTAMIGLMFVNFIWSWFIWIMLIFMGFVIIGLIAQSKSLLMAIIGLVVFGIYVALVYFTWGLDDPVYWLYQNIIFPVLSFVSFGTLDKVLYMEGAPFLFIAGAVSANAKFRDGHKYQGPIGLLNAWGVGFVLLYAMLYHGLLVAIILHALYDIQIHATQYIGRKFS
jgi:hypothetical protein